MEFGRGPVTPSHGGGLSSRLQRTPQSRTRNRSDSGPGLQSPGPGGLARINQSPGPGSLAMSCVTPSRRDLMSGQVSQLASTASPHSVCATPTARPVSGGERGERSPVSMRVRTLFSALPISPKFSLCEQIGEGTFSTVYLAEDAKKKTQLALKHLVPTSKPARIMMEANCMKAARGHPNVVQLLGVWRVQGDVILAMPYLSHCKFIDLVAKIELEEVKLYIANLLAALAHIHKLGIIHRDIKPSNFLYDRQRKKFSLVDFGLAQWESELQVPAVKGSKRKLESPGEVSSKKARAPLTESTSTLNCSRSPKARLLREHRSPGLRRSPRKMINLSEALGSGEIKSGMNVTLPLPTTPSVNLNALADVPKRLNFGVSGSSGKKSASSTPVRCSPRKLSMASRGGISTLKITNNSIISPDLSTPSPTTMSRTPSFSHLDPSQASQPTDMLGRTPLLRASVTSHCSSVLPRQPEVSVPSPASGHVSCTCPGSLSVCVTCLALPHLHAARAGTPGFRPPEVLLKCRRQTVAVDMWAAGVILLSILARSYPFFRSPDDITALAELISLFGSEALQSVAKKYNRNIVASHLKEGAELGSLCRALGERCGSGDTPPPCLVTSEGIDLLKRLLELDHEKRVTATGALKHPFLKDVSVPS